MVNRLITTIPKVVQEPYISKSFRENGNFTIYDYVRAFLNGMDDVKKEKFKKMFYNGFATCEGIAKTYNIDCNKFLAELQNQLEKEKTNANV